MAGTKAFEAVFDAYFHQKIKFDEFLKLNISDEVNKIKIGDKDAYSCSKKLKKIHQFLIVFVLSKVEIKSDVVFSYRKKLNVVNAIYPHAKKRVIYKTDIKSFFPSIKISDVRDMIMEHANTSMFSDLGNYIDNIINAISINDNLPIGFPTSPVVSNFSFYKYDVLIKSYSDERGYVYTRYADDILISSDEYIDKEIITKEITNIFETQNSKYKLNKNKTKILPRGSQRVIFGVSILPDGKLTISKKLKNDIETKIHLYLTDKGKFLEYSKLSSMEFAVVNISGILNHVNTIDKYYLDKLKIKYGTSIIGLFFRKTIENEYRS